jgi:hypothetical protein
MRIRHLVQATLGLALLAGISSSAPASKPAEARPDTTNRETDREGWPDTRAAALAHRWVRAFGQGEKAMKQCLTEIMAPASLEKTDMKVRVERYRDLRERFGKLTLTKIEKSTEDEVEATLAAEDLSEHHFIFAAQSVAPYKLLTVSIKQQGHGMPGFGH